MYTNFRRGVPARNNDALKHLLPVRLAQRGVPSSALTAPFVTSCHLPLHSLSQHFPLIFPSPIWAAIRLFSPFPWYCSQSCTTSSFSDTNSSLTLSSPVQFWFLTRNQTLLRSSCFHRPSNLIADSFRRVSFLLQLSETWFCFSVTPSTYISEYFLIPCLTSYRFP